MQNNRSITQSEQQKGGAGVGGEARRHSKPYIPHPTRPRDYRHKIICTWIRESDTSAPASATERRGEPINARSTARRKNR